MAFNDIILTITFLLVTTPKKKISHPYQRPPFTKGCMLGKIGSDVGNHDSKKTNGMIDLLIVVLRELLSS